jgi:exonuclease III
MNLYYQNVGGIRTQLQEVYMNSLLGEHDLIVLTETWLNESHHDPEILSPEYNIYRVDRKFEQRAQTRGGGVLTAVKSTYPSEVFHRFNEAQFEAIIIKVSLPYKAVYVCAAYFPPLSKIEVYEQFYEKLTNLITAKNEAPIFILGDLNLSDYQLTNGEEDQQSSKVTQLLHEFLSLNSLKQINAIANEKQRFLDLVITNTSQTYVRRCKDPLKKEVLHHPSLVVSFNSSKIKYKPSKPVKACYNFKKADFEGLYKHLNELNWSQVVECKNVEQSVNLFYELFNTTLDLFVPKFVPSANEKKKKEFLKKSSIKKKLAKKLL